MIGELTRRAASCRDAGRCIVLVARVVSIILGEEKGGLRMHDLEKVPPRQSYRGKDVVVSGSDLANPTLTNEDALILWSWNYREAIRYAFLVAAGATACWICLDL